MKIMQLKKEKRFHEKCETALLTVEETYYRFGGSYHLLRKQVTQRAFPDAIIVIGKKILIDPIRYSEFLEAHRVSNQLRKEEKESKIFCTK